MSIDANELVRTCKGKLGSGTATAFGRVIRSPLHPVMLVFLGEHDDACRSGVSYALRMSWPSHFTSVDSLSFETPEAYARALEYDENEQMAMEDAIIAQCTPQKHYASPTDVILVYFLNLNAPHADEFLSLLDRPVDTPAGGHKTRYLFAMNRCSRGIDLRHVKERLQRLYAMSQSGDPLWNSTYLFSMGNTLQDATVLNDEQLPDGYALAVETLLLRNSVGQFGDPQLLLPAASNTKNNLITCALKRIEKPADEIVRTVLSEYLAACIRECGRSGDGQEGVSEQALYDACVGAITRLFDERVMPFLPKPGDLAGLPGGVRSPAEAGEGSGEDRTFGVYRAFREKYFSSCIGELCGGEEAMEDFFEDALSARFNCAEIRRCFLRLGNLLRQGGNPFLPAAPAATAGLYDFCLYAAQKRMAELSLAPLRRAVEALLSASEVYVATLSQLQVQLNPHDPSVEGFYRSKVELCLANPHADMSRIAAQMKRPCGEAVLSGRLLAFFDAILTENFMRMGFEEEMTARIGQAAANRQLTGVLNLPVADMDNCARMRLANLDRIADFVMLDPGASYAGQTSIAGTRFDVSRSDCVERVAFYAFDVNLII